MHARRPGVGLRWMVALGVLLLSAGRASAAEEAGTRESVDPGAQLAGAPLPALELPGSPGEIRHISEPRHNPQVVQKVKKRRKSPEVYYGAELFMAQGKLIPALDLDVQFRFVGFGFEFGLIFLQEGDASPVVDGGFLGGELGFHMYGRLVRTPRWDLRLGTGADLFPLWGIHGDELHAMMPLILEGRLFSSAKASNRLTAFFQLRMPLLHDQGLEVGVDREGIEHVPLLLVVGLGGWS
jgi:hypothetical protein